MTAQKGMWIKLRLFSIVQMAFFLSWVSHGTTFLELQSSYLGDGWFRYRLKTYNEPFFLTADVSGFSVNRFTNRVEYAPTPEDWVAPSSSNLNSAYWTYNATNHQAKPYEREFLIRSTESTYRVSTNCTVIMSLQQPADWQAYMAGERVYMLNILGYCNLPCLYPCAPEEADGSSSEFTCHFKITPDIVIENLVITNGSVHGLVFDWHKNSTVLLQGSGNQTQWTNVAYLYGNAGTTTWTTNQPLNAFGNFFRLQLVAIQHVTNLPPLNGGSATPPSSFAQPAMQVVAELNTDPVRGCSPDGDEMVVKFVSQLGTSYVVNAMDRLGNSLASQTVMGTDAVSEARFRKDSLPDLVFFSVELEQ